jgi:hypothetical protein
MSVSRIGKNFGEYAYDAVGQVATRLAHRCDQMRGFPQLLSVLQSTCATPLARSQETLGR